MSTFYLDVDSETLEDLFEDHYGVNFDESVEYTDAEYCEELIPLTVDVVLTDTTAFFVVKAKEMYTLYWMGRTEFITNWSESVWAKFRADRKVVCPLCGEKQAEFVSGATYMERLEQYYCENCNEAYITNAYGKLMRKGVLSDPIDARDYW